MNKLIFLELETKHERKLQIKAVKKRVLIVGLGSMGSKHLAAVERGDSFKVVGIVDPNSSVNSQNYPLFGSLKAALATVSCDAAIVAVPCEIHFRVAQELLKMNIPVLLEKPFVQNVHEAELLMLSAQETSLMIGHSERFNPVVIAIKKNIPKLGVIRSIQMARRAPLRRLLGDRDVVYDLLVHDLDLVFMLLGRSVEVLETLAPGNDFRDYVELKMLHNHGTKISIIADRLTGSAERSCVIRGDSGVLWCDLLNLNAHFLEANGFGSGEVDISFVESDKSTPLNLRKEDALESEHAYFRGVLHRGTAGDEPLLSAFKSVEVCAMVHAHYNADECPLPI